MEGPVWSRDNIGNHLPSRLPFRNLRQSPWKHGRGMNEKTLTDNLRVLVKPATPHQTKQVETREARSTSPFRTLKPHSNGVRMSPWVRHNTEIDEEPKMKLHESEINIYKQLCLDKHDENAAIEILLDSAESSIPELYTASSESSDYGSRTLSRKKAGSVEGKRKFLGRFFFKSQHKSSTQFVSSADFLDSSKENNISMSHSSNVIDEPNIPSPPSSIPRTRISVVNTLPSVSNVAWAGPLEKSGVDNNVERTRSILDDIHEGGDTTSNISSLSGIRTSSLITPVNFNRHESLGFESIKDIRKCLKEMEHQLGQATNKGQRVSRQKVMRALFTVADSLEDDEEKSHLKKELRTSMEAKKDKATQPVATKHLKLDSSDDDKSELTTSDDGDFTLDSGTFEEEIDEDTVTNESPFNIVSSVGNFFGVDTQNQHAVEEVLDDLLWTEFVSSRQGNSKKKKNSGVHSRSNTSIERGRKMSLHVKEYEKSHNKGQGSRARSWWRNHPSKEEDDYSSSSSEDEFKSYLPTSITVKKRYKKPTEFENAFPRSVSNSHYKVKLVDTESRLGYEMDNTSRRSSVI
jgi:hypothetical protein